MKRFLLTLAFLASCNSSVNNKEKFIDDGLTESYKLSELIDNHNNSELPITYNTSLGKTNKISDINVQYTSSSKNDEPIKEIRHFSNGKLALLEQYDLDNNSSKLHQRIAIFDTKISKEVLEYRIFKDCWHVSIKLDDSSEIIFTTKTKDVKFTINTSERDLPNKILKLKEDATTIFEIKYEEATNVVDTSDKDDKLFWVKATATAPKKSTDIIVIYYKAFLKTDTVANGWENLVVGDGVKQPEKTVVLYDKTLDNITVKPEKHLRIIKNGTNSAIWNGKHLIHKYDADQDMATDYNITGATAPILKHLLPFTILDEVSGLLTN